MRIERVVHAADVFTRRASTPPCASEDLRGRVRPVSGLYCPRCGPS
jgi:hypothetical protein